MAAANVMYICACACPACLTSAMSDGSTPRSSHSVAMPSAIILVLSPASAAATQQAEQEHSCCQVLHACWWGFWCLLALCCAHVHEHLPPSSPTRTRQARVTRGLPMQQGSTALTANVKG